MLLPSHDSTRTACWATKKTEAFPPLTVMLLFADCFFPVSFLLFTVLVPHHTLIVLM
jgi:hypothetical protein